MSLAVATDHDRPATRPVAAARIVDWARPALRVAQLVGSPSLLGGGVSTAVMGLTRGLQARPDTAPAVVAADPMPGPPGDSAWGAVPVAIVRSRGPARFRYAPDVGRLLDDGAFDLAHCHLLWTWMAIACRRWARRHGRPYLVSTHGMLDGWALGHRGAQKRLARLLFEDANLAGAACLHALNIHELRAIRALGLTNPVAVIPNGVDLPDLSAPTTSPAWAGRAARTLLFLGRLHRKKGLGALLDAFAAATSVPHRPAADWQLVIAGWDEGGYGAELERSAQSLGLENRVVFTGPLHGADKEAAFAAADAFILPSLSEGQPVAVLEAWAHGLPVLMTAACNLPEGFDAGAAIEVESEATALSASLMELFLLSDADRAAMGASGRRLVEARYAWDRSAARMRAVYAWIADGAARPSDVVTGGCDA